MSLQRLAPEFEVAWLDHVRSAWFPRCLDLEAGGFFTGFDQRWQKFGPQERLLEFQARQTMLACEGWMSYPGDSLLRQAAHHGFAYLREQLWDAQFGGWFHRLSRQGEVLEGRTKHVHGMAYALQACASYYRSSGQPEGLALAQEAFEWLEAHSHDSQHGGYLGMLEASGKPILEPVPAWPHPEDSIGTPLGYKDQNLHSDLLEALLALAIIWPDARVLQRAEEISRLLLQHALAPNGSLWFFHTRDWRPVPHAVVLGNAFQTVCRLLWVGRLLGQEATFQEASRSIVKWALRCAQEPGLPGFVAATVSQPPYRNEGATLGSRQRRWWVQYEGLRALLLWWELQGEEWLVPLVNHWRYLQKTFQDPHWKGHLPGSTCHLANPWQRVWERWRHPQLYGHKAWDWKDGSHDGRALLHALRCSRGESGQELWPNPRRPGL